MNPYIPNDTGAEGLMLEAVGYGSVRALIETQIPSGLIDASALSPRPGLAEFEVKKRLSALAAKNHADPSRNFCGGGHYAHFCPSVIDYLSSRSEFLTSYTPYQPEISQGTLQALYEYQTMVARLLGMDVSNASLYDGASAFAEALLMARRIKPGKNVVLVSEAVHPDWLRVASTYVGGLGVELVSIPVDSRTGKTDLARAEELAALHGAKLAAVAVQSPNFFGVFEDQAELFGVAKARDALCVGLVNDPTALALVRSPGENGADIVAGEGQSLGNPMSFGGPGVGLFACGEAFLRQLPGRLAGKTLDVHGKTSYTLTLSTREQHIRREKATSNICSNQGVAALRTAMYLALAGETGLKNVARASHSRALGAMKKLTALPGVEPLFPGNAAPMLPGTEPEAAAPAAAKTDRGDRAATLTGGSGLTRPSYCYHEFALRVKGLGGRYEKALAAGLVPGIRLSLFPDLFSRFEEPEDILLLAFNETHTDEDTDRLAEALR